MNLEFWQFLLLYNINNTTGSNQNFKNFQNLKLLPIRFWRSRREAAKKWNFFRHGAKNEKPESRRISERPRRVWRRILFSLCAP